MSAIYFPITAVLRPHPLVNFNINFSSVQLTTIINVHQSIHFIIYICTSREFHINISLVNKARLGSGRAFGRSAWRDPGNVDVPSPSAISCAGYPFASYCSIGEDASVPDLASGAEARHLRLILAICTICTICGTRVAISQCRPICES